MSIFLKRAVGRVVASVTSRCEDAIVVLNYHSVGTGAPGCQPISRFREQLGWLADNHNLFTVLPLRLAFTQKKMRSGASVLITFDDGYRDNAEIVAPILEEFGYRGAFFVSSAFLDGDTRVISGFKNYHGLDHMTWDQVARLAETGHEIGSHGHIHPDYGAISREQAEEDISRSLDVIRSRTGITVVSFAYPFGQPRHLRSDFGPVFERLGIRYAFTTAHRRFSVGALGKDSTRFAIPRLRIDPQDTLPVFVEKVNGIWDWVATAQTVKSAIRVRNRSDQGSSTRRY
jgi:peptidoglycan/xylan/chitin deacetylase (PgdA/CDA1 family)